MGILSNVEGILSLWTEQFTLWIESKIVDLANGIPNAGGNLLDIFIGLVAAFYFLMEKQKLFSICGSFSEVFLGKKIKMYLKRLFHEVYTVFSSSVLENSNEEEDKADNSTPQSLFDENMF